MAIERTGKGASAPPQGSTPKEGATRSAGGAPFEVSRKDAGAGATGAAGAGGAEVGAIKASPALEGVRSGALDVKGYVDAKVDEATAHLTHLSATQLETVKSVVRAQLVSDPHLAELVQHATGVALPKEDES